MRNSIFVWVGGAVLGWVLIVVFGYNLIRFSDDENIVKTYNEQHQEEFFAGSEADALNDIAPAAGGDGEKQEIEDPLPEPEDE